MRRSRWHQYHRLRERTDRLIAIGDSVCALNPVHAQGVTVAAFQALALRETLGRYGDLSRAARTFQRRVVRRTLRDPWMAATCTDLGWSPDQRGRLLARATWWYLGQVRGSRRGRPVHPAAPGGGSVLSH